MLNGYFGLTFLHIQKEMHYVQVKLGDVSFLLFLDNEVRCCLRLEQVDRIPLFTSPCPLCAATPGEKRKDKDGVSLAFGIAGPHKRVYTHVYGRNFFSILSPYDVGLIRYFVKIDSVNVLSFFILRFISPSSCPFLPLLSSSVSFFFFWKREG